MKKFFSLFKDSAREFKSLKAVTTCGMLGAIAIILGYITIQPTESIKIGFSTIPNDIAAFLYGPVMAPIFGALMDILKYLIKPTGPFFPGFTITAAVYGLIMGVGLYKKPVSFKRLLIASGICVLICDICLNTIWLSMLYGNAVSVILPARVIKSLILWPIQCVMSFAVIKAMIRAGLMQPLTSVDREM